MVWTLHLTFQTSHRRTVALIVANMELTQLSYPRLPCCESVKL